MKLTKNLILLCLISVLGALGVGACHSPAKKAAKPQKARFGDMIGLNVKYAQGEKQDQAGLDNLKELGVRWVRDTVLWHEMEPKPGQYNEFPKAFRERIDYYKANNIGINFLLVYGNGGAYPDTKDNPLNSINAEAFGRYAAFIARKLKEENVKFVLELWNEPHNFVILKMAGGEWNGKPPSPWVDHYVKMVREAVKQVKAYDPSVKLMTDEDVWVNHYEFLARGLPSELDGFGIHPYWNKISKGPEDTGVWYKVGWALPYILTDENRSLASAVSRLKAEGLAKMGRVPLMWATEIGCNVGADIAPSPLNPTGKVSEEAVSAYLVRTMVTSAEIEMETVYWFSSYDGPDGAFGLRANDGRRRKAFYAFKEMTAQLSEFRHVAQLSGKDHPTTGLQAHTFSGPGGPKAVLWSLDGPGVFSGPMVRKGKIKVTDVQGQDIPVKYTDDGRPLFNLNESPVYVTGLASIFELTAEVAK